MRHVGRESVDNNLSEIFFHSLSIMDRLFKMTSNYSSCTLISETLYIIVYWYYLKNVPDLFDLAKHD
jgi:hypothetical protein